MTEADKIVALVLEADEEGETIKDILGPEYQEPLPAEPSEKGVYRHDRWADVQVGDQHFCISYLTPVAYYSGSEVVRTEKQWSTSTVNHIKKWLDHIGFDVGRDNWQEVQRRFPKTMPQQALVELFKKESMRVKWTKREAKTMGAVPYNKIRTGLKSDREHRVELDPYHEPRREWE
jgi:hypothetical protein